VDSDACLRTLPLLLTLPGLSFTDAYFESMSGITTTGATVLIGLDVLPPAVNLWRHELNWLGGMGIICWQWRCCPAGHRRPAIVQGETPGDEGFCAHPRINRNSAQLVAVYAGITLVCIGFAESGRHELVRCDLSRLCGNGLGGFSTHDASVGFYNSPAIEFVLIVFMLLRQ